MTRDKHFPAEDKMTNIEAQINEAFEMIDKELSRLQSREFVSAIETSDVLLDLRLLLMHIELKEDPVSVPS